MILRCAHAKRDEGLEKCQEDTFDTHSEKHSNFEMFALALDCKGKCLRYTFFFYILGMSRISLSLSSDISFSTFSTFHFKCSMYNNY